MSVVNSDSSEPAFPILAHSLLSQHTLNTSSERNEAGQGRTLPKNQSERRQSWDLRHDIETGLRGSPDTVFRLGTVIGFSKLRNWRTADDDEYIGQVDYLPVYLFVSVSNLC
jgi:hypothetical protein